MAKSFVDKTDDEFSRLLDWGLRLTFLLAMPAAVALAVLSMPLVAGLFHYGKFTILDVEMTRQALMAYSLGLLGLILVKVLAPAFYSRQNIKTPVKIAIVTLIATQLMNLIFIGSLKHAGLALAIGLGACFNAGLLYFYLRRSKVFKPQSGWPKFLSKLLVALLVMAVVLKLVAGTDEVWLHYHLLEKLLRLSLLLFAGAGSYFLTLWLLGIRIDQFIHRTTQ